MRLRYPPRSNRVELRRETRQQDGSAAAL